MADIVITDHRGNLRNGITGIDEQGLGLSNPAAGNILHWRITDCSFKNMSKIVWTDIQSAADGLQTQSLIIPAVDISFNHFSF